MILISFPGSLPGIYFGTSSPDNHPAIRHRGQKRFRVSLYRILRKMPTRNSPSNNASPDNIFSEGILGIQTSIDASNCLVSNCGSNIVLGYGGDYHFINCTVAGYSNNYIQHAMPGLTLTNYIVQGSNTLVAPLNGRFTNCIFWGDNGTVDDEVQVLKQGTNPVFNVLFDYSLLGNQIGTLRDMIHQMSS